MSNFLIESAICQLVFLAVYFAFLQNEKMYRFNRFYLLTSVIASLVIPFINIEIIKEIPAQAATMPILEPVTTVLQQEESVSYLPFVFLAIYGLITLVVAVRFAKNIIQLNRKTQSGISIEYRNAKLVLLAEETLPHTFLDTIFVNKNDYENRNIEDELYQHELTHVRQKHSLDILFIESLKVIFWFNPLLYFYKKAIQLNHEFLADEKVISSSNIPFYQTLLLSKANISQTYYLASNLNYSLTKKRFIMMTKTTSKMKSMLYKLALIPVLTAIVFFLCVEITAQNKPSISAESLTEKPSNDERNAYYAGVRVIAKETSGKILVDKKYEDLTAEEKERFLFHVPKKLEKKSPTEMQFNGLKDAKKHAIWIDGVHVSNLKLNEYRKSDFVMVTTSYVYENARSKKFPQPFQSHLYTEPYFDKTLKESHKKFSGDKIEIVVGKYDKSLEKKKKNLKFPQEIVKTKDSFYLPKNRVADQDDQIYSAVEIQPEFPGGIGAFYKYVMENFKIPAGFKGNGKIIAQFVVEKDGSLSGIKVLRDIGFDSAKETERILKESPKWKPGMQNGKTVRVMYALPISINN